MSKEQNLRHDIWMEQFFQEFNKLVEMELEKEGKVPSMKNKLLFKNKALGEIYEIKKENGSKVATDKWTLLSRKAAMNTHKKILG